MYFTNISDAELSQYHEQVKTNFSTKMPTSSNNLFKVEIIKANSIYKIYPLFYCETIESTNPNDKILDNKCIICNKETIDTYLTFKTPLNKLDLSNVNFGYDFIPHPTGITIYCYDKNTGNPLSNVSIEGTTRYSSSTENFAGVTGDDGLFYTTFGTIVIDYPHLKLSYDGIDYLLGSDD